MSAGAPRVFSIPPGVPFALTLAGKILSECEADPLRLTAYTILLPTRRAVRSLREAFLRHSGGKTLLLPRMMPIGDIDEEALAFAAESSAISASTLEIPPAIPELRRRLLLAQLIRKIDARPAEQAILLAAELGRLLDQVETERIGFEPLANLVPERYARHWQITLEFLRIVTEHWPKILEAAGAIDPATRRNRLLDAQAALWCRRPPADPVIAAGSTGSIPATADLLRTVASLPTGRVVLPGLDRHLDVDAWEMLEPSHPQYGLKRLLGHFGIERRDVPDWSPSSVSVAGQARATLLAEAMRPAGSTEKWRQLSGTLSADALHGLRLIECPTPREESGVVALLMREALEAPGRTAALVTPDRALARRVAAELERWGIEVDDSAGTPLDATPPGSFLRLLAQAAAEDLAPLALVALLKHPLAAGGMEPARFRRRARRLEIALLRGPRPASGIEGLRGALSTVDDIDQRRKVSKLIDVLEAALGPFLKMLRKPTIDLSIALTTHMEAAEALAASEAETGVARLWAGDAGEAAAKFVTELTQSGAQFPPVESASYPAFFGTLLGGQVVRQHYGRHPRLSIWGPLEARLQQADLFILSGLNESTWPPLPPVDPWMSRPMRSSFGLPETERRIGLSAHDFAQAASAPEIVLTRALKVEGAPTVPARWLLRLENLLRAAGFSLDRSAAVQLLAWHAALDRPHGPPKPVSRPAPCPPWEARPRELSVTEIEMWMRDPYSIYARHILGLRAFDPLDADPGAAERGTFIHRALDRFLKKCPGDLPGNALDILLTLGAEAFGEALERPGVRAFWWPRFKRIAAWFIETERARRPATAAIYSETKGSLIIEAPRGPFRLTARADRIDRQVDGRLAIVDYKTGTLPNAGEVEAGLSPQLPLEAAMASDGAFHDVPAREVHSLAFWRLSGGEPAGEIKALKGDARDLAREALIGLERLIAAFDNEATRYEARPRADQAPRYSDYVHLARIKEWSATGKDDE